MDQQFLDRLARGVLQNSPEPVLHYQFVRRIGEGGMGIVFEAHDTQLDRPVAIKVLRPQVAADPVARERFIMEARAVAALNHPHVVTVHAVEASIPMIVMELLRGESLEARLRRKGALGSLESVVLARSAVDGLQAAHERGLLHRDVKPANVWLEPPDSGAEIRNGKASRFRTRRTIEREERRWTYPICRYARVCITGTGPRRAVKCPIRFVLSGHHVVSHVGGAVAFPHAFQVGNSGSHRFSTHPPAAHKRSIPRNFATWFSR